MTPQFCNLSSLHMSTFWHYPDRIARLAEVALAMKIVFFGSEYCELVFDQPSLVKD